MTLVTISIHLSNPKVMLLHLLRGILRTSLLNHLVSLSLSHRLRIMGMVLDLLRSKLVQMAVLRLRMGRFRLVETREVLQLVLLMRMELLR